MFLKLVISNSYSEMPTVAAGWVLSISNFLFSLLPYRTIVNLMMKFHKDDPYTQRILRNSFSIDKKMLLAMKTAPFPTHTNELTMRRDIFNEMIIDFFEDRPLRAYNDVVIERKQS
ncbi:hypothetical protein [Paenibacillus sp. E194]|uniref:hypothetical protein n=1 Tax=Paenibacillus sp. E194 TaxID=1458845 RepID=UPI0006968F94|nr:hypothetical protein [Paenibacillus sp. E194]